MAKYLVLDSNLFYNYKYQKYPIPVIVSEWAYIDDIRSKVFPLNILAQLLPTTIKFYAEISNCKFSTGKGWFSNKVFTQTDYLKSQILTFWSSLDPEANI